MLVGERNKPLLVGERNKPLRMATRYNASAVERVINTGTLCVRSTVAAEMLDRLGEDVGLGGRIASGEGGIGADAHVYGARDVVCVGSVGQQAQYLGIGADAAASRRAATTWSGGFRAGASGPGATAEAFCGACGAAGPEHLVSCAGRWRMRWAERNRLTDASNGNTAWETRIEASLRGEDISSPVSWGEEDPEFVEGMEACRLARRALRKEEKRYRALAVAACQENRHEYLRRMRPSVVAQILAAGRPWNPGERWFWDETPVVDTDETPRLCRRMRESFGRGTCGGTLAWREVLRLRRARHAQTSCGLFVKPLRLKCTSLLLSCCPTRPFVFSLGACSSAI